MVHSTQNVTAGVLLLYFGAFLSGLRPAIWYGSRSYPLFSGIFLCIALQIILKELFPFRAILMILGPLAEICFVIAILHVARARDFS
jgi:hypothetical protein